ncbi:SpaA isopeptide-forming pilin-related protein [Listeria grandensis]|uniref:SpaA isopeptide-forming pilin-related protein n=1 Tax=Listeria grandensis TaxID=1494963 RepID=UPI00164E0331|nr:SpaA isopeptide-forming pilin-related protein [Listeria grandensis]MBC6316323.1 cell wall anchor protein [Listeria grandensis]
MMKRVFSLFAALLLILQMILPQLVTAQATEDTKEVDGVTLLNTVVNNDTNGAATYKLDGRVVNHSDKEILGTIKVSENVLVSAFENRVVLDGEQKVIGNYDVKNNTISFLIPAQVDTIFNFQVNGELLGDAKTGTVTFSDGIRTISKEMSKPEVERKVPEKSNATLVAPLVREGPQDLKDIFAALGYRETERSILADMVVTYKDPDGNVVTEPTVEDSILFSFDWKIMDDVGALVNEGDFYTFKLPDNIKISKNMIINLGEYGSAKVNMDGTVTITFTDAVKGSSEVRGTLNFNAGFNENGIDGPGDMIIKIPDEVNLPSTEVMIKPKPGSTIDKGGYFDKVQNPNRVIWHVDVNKSLDKLLNARVTEAFPEGLTYESVQVYQMDVDLHGNVVAESEKLVTTGYVVDQDGNVTFTDPINHAYRLIYNTLINEDQKSLDGGTVSFKNKATLSSDDDPEGLTASATVDASYGKILTKSSTNYDSDKQTFEWTVKYNYGEKHIAQKDAVIKDTFGSDRMILIDTSAKLHTVTFDQDGREMQGALLVVGVDYELVKTATGFEIRFLHDVDSAVKIKYKTGISGTVDENINVSNRVDIDTGQTGGSSGTLYQQNLVKKLASVDYENKRASWTIDVNKNHYVMKNWELTDTWSNGLKLLPESLKIYDVDGERALVEGTDYEFVYDQQANIFKIAFLNDYKVETEHQFKISYDTVFDTNASWYGSETGTFKNSATGTWLDEFDKPHTSDDEVIFNPNNPTKYNGFKQGAYNARSGLITWTIGINYDGKPLDNAKIVDPILGNQQFVPNSVKIYHYSVNPDGSIVKGAEIEDHSDFVINEPSKRNQETLTVNFPDGKVAQYLVEFETSVKGQLVSANYKNDAVFKNDSYPDRTLSADVSVKHGGKLALKSGEQDDDGFVNWSVTVNPSLSQMDDVVVTDRPSTNQTIDLDSLVVHGTVVSVDGTLSVNPHETLIRDEDYTVTLTTDNETGQQELKVRFIGEIDAAYVIQYRTMVLMTGSRDKVSNNVKITGNHEEEVTGGDGTELDVIVSDGGGTAVGTKGSISFQKVDGNGQVLRDAEFQLLDKNNRVVMRDGVVDGNGKLTFGNLPYGTYVLKEVKAPAGYTVSDELAQGKKVTISRATSRADMVQEIVNTPNKVTLVKQDEAGQALSGAVFKLQWQVGTDWLDIRSEETFKTGTDGKLVIDGLLPANYRMIETEAPQGFIINSEPIPFVVAEDSNGQIADVTVGPFVNYQGSIAFMKQDETGRALAGAEFELKDQSGTVLQIMKSDESGQVSATGLAPGVYTVMETKAPTGYTLNTKSLEFVIATALEGKPAVKTLANFTNYQGSATLVKKNDSGDLLAGAVFKVVDENGVIVRENLVTNEAGEIHARDLAPGAYQFVEVSAPTGYLVNTTPVAFTIADKAHGKLEAVQKTFTDYQGRFELRKVNSDNEPLSGAVFELRNEDGDTVKTIATGEDGLVAATDIAPGQYTLVEVKAPRGYILNSYPIAFEIPESAPDVPTTVDLGNFTNFKGKVALVKQGEDEEALAGAEFTIYDIDGKVVGKPVAASDGRVDYGDLAPGYYKIAETKAPHGYIINTNPIYFTILDTYPGNLDLMDTGHITNYQGKIEFRKTDETHHGLADAKFKLINRTTGETLQTDIISGEDGGVTLANLHPGEYQLIETEAPHGYILNTAPMNFTIKRDLLGAPEVVQLGDFINYQGSVVLKKTDDFKNPLAGATFDLLDDKKQVIATNLTSASGGEIKVGELAPGDYYFTETQAPNGYEKKATPIPFTVTAEAEGKPTAIQLQFANQKTPTKLPPVEHKEDHKKDNKATHPSKRPMTPSKDTKLPETGDNQSESILFMMMGALLLAGWSRMNRK